jgi:hypothetical protein
LTSKIRNGNTEDPGSLDETEIRARFLSLQEEVIRVLKTINQEGSLPDSKEEVIESLDYIQGAIDHIRSMLSEVVGISNEREGFSGDGLSVAIDLGSGDRNVAQGVILLGDGQSPEVKKGGDSVQGEIKLGFEVDEVGMLADRKNEYAMLLGTLLERVGVGDSAPIFARLDEAMERDGGMGAQVAEKVAHLIRGLSEMGVGSESAKKPLSMAMDNEIITIKVIALDYLLSNVRNEIAFIIQYMGTHMRERGPAGLPLATVNNANGLRDEASKVESILQERFGIDPKNPRPALPDGVGDKDIEQDGRELVSRIDSTHSAMASLEDGMERGADWLAVFYQKIQELFLELTRYTELATQMDAFGAMDRLGTIATRIESVKVALISGLKKDGNFQKRWANALVDMQLWIAILKYQMDSHHAKIRPLVGHLQSRQTGKVLRRPDEIEKRMGELKGDIEKGEKRFFGIQVHLNKATQKEHGERLERLRGELEALEAEHRVARARRDHLLKVQKGDGRVKN